MNSGLGALSPVNYANSIIGRAWTLMSICFGDMRPGATFTASIGTTINYNNMCCAENEENSVWEPFHVRKGFKKEESTVSFFRGWNVMMLGMAPSPTTREVALQARNLGMRMSFTYLIDPLVAKNLKNEEGFEHPDKMSDWVLDQLNPPMRRPDMINFIVVGGEMNPFWAATDFGYLQTIKIDPWIPKAGIKHDAVPYRMPEPVMCKDGSCGIQM